MHQRSHEVSFRSQRAVPAWCQGRASDHRMHLRDMRAIQELSSIKSIANHLR